MWWRTVLVLSLLAIIENKAELDSNGTDPQTQPQLCCPCPPGWPGTVGGPHTQVLETAQPAVGTDVSSVGSVGGVDDCPCRSRDADSTGASSVFSPNTVRASGNNLRPETKEEVKPLLHPEVDLASSVLETLREATDEEYRDALERDAARAAASDVTHDTPDGVPEEARNAVTIVVSPRDMDDGGDALSEASHVQETRCIHSPLGNPRASFNYRSPVHQRGLEEILNLPLPSGLLHRQRDSNWAPSNVHESIVRADNHLNNILSGLKLRTDPGLFKLTPTKVDNGINRFEGKNRNRNTVLEETNTREFSEIDSDDAPSNIQRESLHAVRNDDIESNSKAEFEIPFPLKNLIKLRDVELVPLNISKKILNSKFNISNVTLKPLRNRPLDPPTLPRLSDILSKPSKAWSKNERTNVDTDFNDNTNVEKMNNIQTIPRKNVVTTEILDALPSPSEMNQAISVKDDSLRLTDTESETDENSLDSTNTGIVDDEGLNDDFGNIDNIEFISNGEGHVRQIDNNHQEILSQAGTNNPISSSVDNRKINGFEDTTNRPVLKSLQEVRKSVVEKLDALHKKNLNVLGINDGVNEQSGESEVIEIVNEDPQEFGKEDEFSRMESLSQVAPSMENIRDEFKDASLSNEEISFDDLQNMSDSILAASEDQENFEVNNADLNDELNEENFMSDTVSEIETNNSFEVDQGRQIATNDFVANTDIDLSKLCPTYMSKQLATNNVEANVSGINKNSKTVNDMESGASEPVISNILLPNSKSLIEHLNELDSKLRQSLIVQPTPLINTQDLNIFRTPALLPDLSELNTNIPTLEEVRARVSEILGGLARDANDDEVSTELDSNDFASNINPVVSTARKSSEPVSIFQSGNPFEDINLDIVQIKPLPLTQGKTPLLSELPGLNLNTYKAKLAVPKSLNLQPLKLASTLGNDGGLVGATLSIEPNKKDKSHRSKGRSKLKSLKSGKSFPGDYSTLADITATVQKNANNLLRTSNPTNGQILQASNVIENIAKNLKDHTENTLRNVHQTLNPSPLENIHTNLRKTADHLLTSGRNALDNIQTAVPINDVVGNLRDRTENTIKNLHQTLRSNTNELNAVIQKSAQNLPSSSNSINAVVDNLRAQSDNVLRRVPQVITRPTLTELSDSIQKTAKSVLKSSGLPSESDLLRSTKQHFASIGETVNNLQSHTENALSNIHQSLNVPNLSDIHANILKSAQQVPIRSNLQPTMPLNSVVDNLKSQTQTTMRHIQQSLSTPNLADVTTTVQKHAQDLLELPFAPQGRNTFEQILEASTPIDLKQHTENVVKDLQKTLKATVRNSPIADLHHLTDPKQVIEAISNHQEDLNDKLFAIHTDLTDRLESIHNDVMDPERLRQILAPPSNSDFELFSIPLPMSRFSAPISKKQTLPVLKSGELSFGKESKKFTAPKVNKPKVQKLGSSQARIPAAASMPIPSHIAKPKSLIAKTPSLSTPFPKDSSKKPLILESSPYKGINKPLLPKYDTLTERNLKAILSPTTQQSAVKPMHKTKKVDSTTLKPKVPTKKPNRFKPKPPVRQPTPWNGWGEQPSGPKSFRINDPFTSPSRLIPRTQSLLKSDRKIPIKTEKLPRIDSLSSKLKAQPITLMNPKPNLKSLPTTQGRTSNNIKQHLSSEMPKTSLISKLTDALKKKEGIASSASGRTNLGEKMTPSASGRVEKVTALEEPMKENINYKCRMMCVKLD